MLLGNPEIQDKDRLAIVERLERFFRDLLKHPQPREAAIKVENSIYEATTTREEYKKMIMSKMQYLQATIAGSNGGSGAQSAHNPPPGTAAQPTVAPINGGSGRRVSAHEKAEIKGLIQGVQHKLPIIDKLISLHTNAPTKVDPEVVRKLASLRNVLVKQIGLLDSDTFILTVASTSALVDQINRMLVLFEQGSGQDRCAALAKGIADFQSSSFVPFSKSHAGPVNADYLHKELQYLGRLTELKYFVSYTRADVVRVRLSVHEHDIHVELDHSYPGAFKFSAPIPFTPLQPMSLVSAIVCATGAGPVEPRLSVILNEYIQLLSAMEHQASLATDVHVPVELLHGLDADQHPDVILHAKLKEWKAREQQHTLKLATLRSLGDTFLK